MSFLVKVFSIICFIAFWHLCSTELIASPKQSYEALMLLYNDGVLINGFKDSLFRYLLGLIFGVILALIFGVILALLPRIANFINPIINLLRPISPIAWVPLVVILFGIGDKPTIFIIAYAVFFPVLLLCIASIKETPKELIAITKGFGASKWQIISGVYFPHCFFAMICALKLAASLSWINLVVGEMLGAQTGLGYLIIDARNQLDIASVLGLIFIIGLIGMGINAFFGFIESKMKKRYGYDKD